MRAMGKKHCGGKQSRSTIRSHMEHLSETDIEVLRNRVAGLEEQLRQFHGNRHGCSWEGTIGTPPAWSPLGTGLPSGF